MEFINAENRTIIRRRIACSFCREIGHNVSTCYDVRLFQFESSCIERAKNNSRTEFKDYLDNNSIQNSLLLKSFAIRKCGANSRMSIQLCITRIINYIYEQISEPITERTIEEDNENDLIQLINELRYNRENNNHLDNDIVNYDSMLLRELNNYNEYLLREILLRMINAGIGFNTPNKIFVQITSITNEELLQKCECSICYENQDKMKFVNFNCGHDFCKNCALKIIESNPCCALCRQEINLISTFSEEIKIEFEKDL